jgi:hypothetical protein
VLEKLKKDKIISRYYINNHISKLNFMEEGSSSPSFKAEVSLPLV